MSDDSAVNAAPDQDPGVVAQRAQHSGFATRAIHGGQENDPRTGAVTMPIYQTSTYRADGVGKPRNGYEYARTHNPTRQALEAVLADLEGGQAAIAFASGMAASDAVFKLLKTGDRVIAAEDCYGGTFRYLRQVLEQFGVASDFVADLNAIETFDRYAMIWVETPSNPLLRIADLKDLGERKGNALLVVDNTFATPALQTPLRLGADIVVHSATKYLGGHSDLILGAAITRNEEIGERLRFLQNAVGAVPGPMDCFLAHRGIKTLSLRIGQHSRNASKLAEWLETHPQVSEVFYPGLRDHPNHDVARRQMLSFGGMLSIEVEGGVKAATRFVEATRIFQLAESLGGVESLIELPYVMTHASMGVEMLGKIGIKPGLIRLSVGIEDVADLKADLEVGFKAAQG